MAAATAVSTPALRLLHITDTHLFEQADARLRGVDTYDTLSRVLAHARGHPKPADAVLATGDLSQDESRGAYEHFRSLLAPVGVPVWCLPGNHDAPRLMDEMLTAPPFHVGGAILANGWCAVLLDSYIPDDHGGRLAPGQLRSLEATLSDHREQHVLIAVHHHVLRLRSRWLDELALYNADELLAIIDRSPQVR
jgi:3',5'-cyclic-AMP phosphodiesterase